MATQQLRRKKGATQQPFSTSIGAFEVVPRGTRIVVQSLEPIDERAFAAGFRLDKLRLEPTISDRGRRIEIQVDATFPSGRNTLSLKDLYTPTGNRIDAQLELPFFVVESKIPFPKDVRVESYTRVGINGRGLVRAASNGSAGANATVYELLKGTRRESGEPWEAAYDPAGKTVDFDKIRLQALKSRLERYGKLEPRLYERLQAGNKGPIRVAIWLRGGTVAKPAKNNRVEAASAPEQVVGARKAAQDLGRRFVEQQGLERISKSTRIDSSAPVVFAELDSQQIRRLAELPSVSMIFLYSRETILDLTASMAIAQSDDAHTLGFTGSGVKVAVYEDGPDDTSNLKIEARYQSSPSTSDHSRHTHGIIKNREKNKPHGHAPDCLLHSANDMDLDAIRWAAQDKGCTVISQSFHRDAEQSDSDLSFDDIYKDNLALHWPFPTICEAAGNGADTEYVNHKGFNRLTVANHDDTAGAVASNSVFRNPASDHGDRELPEIAANGTGVTAVGLTKSGTSMAAPAVAGSTACIQEVNTVLKSWPEGCRAIQLAASRLNPEGSTWWDDVIGGVDAQDGTGALNTLRAVRIAEQRKGRNNVAATRGWDVGTLRTSDIGTKRETTFSYRIAVPRFLIGRGTVKVALAWDSDVTEWSFLGFTWPISSVLTVDLDLKVYDSGGSLVGYSGSWDNSYEIAEFAVRPGETYTIKIRRWSGTDDVWYGIAWDLRTSLFRFTDLDIGAMATRGRSRAGGRSGPR